MNLCDIQQEKFLRSYIKECILQTSKTKTTNFLIKEYVRQAILFEDKGLLTEWDIALAYAKGSYALNEIQNVRGRLIVEGLFSSTVDALKWAGQKVGDGVTAVIKAGGEALDVAGKCLMTLLEKIPGGKDAFEMLKEFTVDTANSLKGYLTDAVKQFGKFLDDQKIKIMEAIFTDGSKEQGVISKIKELIEKAKAKPELAEWLNSLLSNPIEAAKNIFDIRAIVGEAANIITKMILKNNTVLNKINKIFEPLTSSKLGMFFLRVISFFSQDMGGEGILTAAGQMWIAMKKLSSKGLDMERIKTSLREMIPDIVQGLIGGGSALESIIRSAAGDPSAMADIFKNAMKMIRKALGHLIGKHAADIVKAAGVDPEGSIGKTVSVAMTALIGESFISPPSRSSLTTYSAQRNFVKKNSLTKHHQRRTL